MFNAIIVIVGEPISLERARKGKAGNWYDPCKKEKQSFALQCLAQWNPAMRPFNNTFEMDASFYCGGHAKDIDNMFKFVADALQDIYWKNDSQIKEIRARIVNVEENPRTVLMIRMVT